MSDGNAFTGRWSPCYCSMPNNSTTAAPQQQHHTIETNSRCMLVRHLKLDAVSLPTAEYDDSKSVHVLGTVAPLPSRRAASARWESSWPVHACLADTRRKFSRPVPFETERTTSTDESDTTNVSDSNTSSVNLSRRHAHRTAHSTQHTAHSTQHTAHPPLDWYGMRTACSQHRVFHQLSDFPRTTYSLPGSSRGGQTPCLAQSQRRPG